MIKRELAKDPKLANESWDRFLPKFRRKHLKTSEKTSRKNERLEAKNAERSAAGLEPIKSIKPQKKIYTPFPPAQLPRKVRVLFVTGNNRCLCGAQVDLQLESGEYFLKPTERKRREERERKQKACFVCIICWTYVMTFHTANCCHREAPCGARGGFRRPSRGGSADGGCQAKTQATRDGG